MLILRLQVALEASEDDAAPSAVRVVHDINLHEAQLSAVTGVLDLRGYVTDVHAVALRMKNRLGDRGDLLDGFFLCSSSLFLLLGLALFLVEFFALALQARHEFGLWLLLNLLFRLSRRHRLLLLLVETLQEFLLAKLLRDNLHHLALVQVVLRWLAIAQSVALLVLITCVVVQLLGFLISLIVIIVEDFLSFSGDDFVEHGTRVDIGLELSSRWLLSSTIQGNLLIRVRFLLLEC